MVFSSEVCLFYLVRIYHILLKWIILGFKGLYWPVIGHNIFEWVTIGVNGSYRVVMEHNRS